ncbi:hypothetical protein ABZ519_39615 [Streptomyces collinus]|uniref:effector-associated domain 2-containing protein n=1 Tax=Streptomyces collinus TaxID=42684 RepID=UPI0033CE4284
MGCVEDAPSRVQFAGLLGGRLHRPVDIRGVRLREDVVSLVTAALSVAGGEHVLVGVVRILEGTPAGDELDRLIAPAPALAAIERAGYFFALRRPQSRLAVRTLLSSGRLTVQGHALVSGRARTLDGWLREEVPPTALDRARTAAALHRTEWRLRNVAPAPAAGPSDLRFRPDRTFWPDTRTHGFATRPTVPRTADEHLAAGDAAAALVRYADILADAPAEPHALAGWIVARTSLEPGRAARRMPARPEELLEPSPRV